MWQTVSNIAAIVAIILLFQLLGLPEWIDKMFKKRRSDSTPTKKIAELEERIRILERKIL